MEEKKNNRGGKRENAGRKKREKEIMPILLNLEIELNNAFPKEILNDNNELVKFNRNAYINAAIREKLVKDGYLGKLILHLSNKNGQT